MTLSNVSAVRVLSSSAGSIMRPSQRARVVFPPRVNRSISQDMTLELTDAEHQALVRLLRRSIDEDSFPSAPR
jgi:hypothetical protein